MEVEIDIKRSAYENASIYFEKAKKLKKKVEKAKKLLEEVKKELEKELKGKKEEKEKKKDKEVKEEKTEKGENEEEKDKEWYEKYRWFFTSNGFLVIGGKNAEQNDEIYYKYFEDYDIFFHADIRGGSAVILKNGVNASEECKAEAAQFAACYSKAWKERYAAVDVSFAEKKYVKKDNLPKGSFYLTKYKRYKNVELKLKVGVLSGKVIAVPAKSKIKLEKEIVLIPGNIEKEEIAEEISKKTGMDVVELMRVIPAGKSSFIF
jgi:predicted ribosome quality control (RQC) complex YloA/Tae2 family protein